MVVGNGMIGTEMKKIDKDDILFFCSGVSSGIEKSQKEFQREINLLYEVTKKFEYDKIIYFGSSMPSNNDIKTYLNHKANVENKIKKLGKKYIILRVHNVVGETINTNTLIPFFVNSIKKSLPINVHETFRSVLDVSDLRKIVSHLISDGFDGEINVNYVELVRIENILFMLSKILNTKPNINKFVQDTDKYEIQHNDEYTRKMLNYLSIGGDGYTEKVLRKYYG